MTRQNFQELSKQIFDESYGDKEEQANVIMCLNKEMDNCPRSHFKIAKCDLCGAEVWISKKQPKGYVSKNAKKWCAICIKKKIDNNQIKIPELTKEVIESGFN